MNQNQTKKYRLQWEQNAWVITDPADSGSERITVDSAVVNATRRGANFVEGYIVASHGLDLSTAANLDRRELVNLGVAAQVRHCQAMRGVQRVHLLAGGLVHGGRNG